ncbi:MAG: AAA family ATPase [Terrimicrobiaceae bacterium]
MIQFPFTAIVGMEQAKKSLIYHAIDPRIGGTLFLGHRGCAKSTLVRAFAEILQSTSHDNLPFVEVPLGTTEDRLLGSVNAETLVEQSKWRGRAGLIEDANGGVLYIDEINLLPDQLADFILDSAASGQYRMERDGITRIVESRYILVGTMNPEEGDLRPQLSDRFAHGVRVQDDFTPVERMEIVQRRIHFDDDPESFVSAYATSTSDLKNRVLLARNKLKEVHISHEHRLAVAAKGEILRLEGIRAELAVVRTARCAAAWNHRAMVEDRDVEEAWDLCLGYREPDRLNTRTPSSVPPEAQSAKSSGAAVARTSPAPLDSHPNPEKLSPSQTVSYSDLQEWWRRPSHRTLAASDRPVSGRFSERPRGPIAWLESLVFSSRMGWAPDRTALHLLYRVPSGKRNLWCFLDASRSTGMSRFLDSARDALTALARSANSARFHLIILEGGRIRWRAWNSTSRRFEAALLDLKQASGKSLIIEGLKTLQRAMLRKGSKPGDRLVIASDGLASPPRAEKPAQTFCRLRHALSRIVRARNSIAWVHPPPKRGLARWLPTLCSHLRVQRVEL